MFAKATIGLALGPTLVGFLFFGGAISEWAKHETTTFRDGPKKKNPTRALLHCLGRSISLPHAHSPGLVLADLPHFR